MTSAPLPLPPPQGPHPIGPGDRQRRRLSRRTVILIGVLVVVGLVFAVMALLRSATWEDLRNGAADALADTATDRDAPRDARGQISAQGPMSVFRLVRGDCYREMDTASPTPAPSRSASPSSSDSAVATFEVVGLPCSDPHQFEVYSTADLPSGDFPGDSAVAETAEERCVASFESFIGKTYDDSELDILYFTPTAQSWRSQDDRSITCAVTGGNSTIGSLGGSAR